MWQNIKGMQVGKDIIEIVCDSEDIKNKILTNGLNIHTGNCFGRDQKCRCLLMFP